MPEYYNSNNRQPRGNDRSARDGRYTRDAGRTSYSDGRYPTFEEGYTSADNRSRQTSGSRRAAQNSQGYDGRFIDAGDRYMRGFEEENTVQPQESQYSSRLAGRYADGSYDSYMPADRYAAAGTQQSRRGGYQTEEYDDYYDRRTAQSQSQRQPVSREYYGQEEYDAPRRRAAGDTRQQYDQQRYDQRGDERYDMTDLAEDNRRSGTERSSQRQSEGYYRAPAGARAKKGSPDVLGGIIDWFNGLTSRQMTWMLAGAALVLVLVILAVCLVLQADSCGSCAGSGDIPVVEQGDGEESLNNGQSFYEDTQDSTEVVSTSDGMITIDEDLETDTFTVEVTGADGTYGRTDVHRADAATLIIANQNETGFEFSLEVKSESMAGSLSGYAYFCGSKEAVYEGAQGLLNFSFGSDKVTVYQMDVIEAFVGMSPDGVYVEGDPSYVEDAAAESEQLGLDADIRTSEAVQTALTGLLSEDDAALLEFIFQNGTERVFEGAEKGYDKNGTAINIDAELNAVKYYAYIEGTGEELVMICTSDAKVYIGICDGAQYRYYTNDPAYAETAPKSISGQAKGRNMELVYQTAS